MKDIIINNIKVDVLEIDAENKMANIEYMENSNGKIKLIQEWVTIEI